MNDYQEQVKQTLELFFQAAQGARGRVLDAGAVRRIASYIQNLHRHIEQLEYAAIGADNMLAAYINEYGDELFNELLELDEVVEGEVVSDGTPEVEGQEGLDDEVEGVHAQVEEQESLPLFEGEDENE